MTNLQWRISRTLSDHSFIPVNHSSIGSEDHCLCGYRPRGWKSWADHVSEVLSDQLASWDFLMELLDEHYPADVFPTLPDTERRDPGPRIVSLIRHLDAARNLT